MKIKILFFLIFSFSNLIAQNVLIEPSGITPVTSSSAIPKLSYDDLIALPSPAIGNMVYDTTFNCFRYHNGTKWIKMLNSQDIPQPSQKTIANVNVNSKMNVKDIKTDRDGNIYIAGNFNTNPINFGTITLNADFLDNYFVAKFSSNGDVIWAKSSGEVGIYGPYYNPDQFIEIDLKGNVYFGNTFRDEYTIGTITFPNPLNNFRSSVLAKYTTDGDLEWVRKFDNTSLSGMLVTDTYKIYLTGYFRGTAYFSTDALISSGLSDVFIAQYDIIGSLRMLVKGGGAADEYSSDIAIDGSGNILLTGNYENGLSSFGNITLPIYTSPKLFLAKLDIINSTWSRAIKVGGNTSYTFGTKLIVDSKNNIYLFADFYGSFELSGTSFASKGLSDLLILKYIDNSYGFGLTGNILLGDRGSDIVKSVHIDSNDNIFVVAQFETLTQLGSITGIGSMAFKMNTDFKILWSELSGYVNCITKSNTDNILYKVIDLCHV
jgi:hypothetical protein